jgi:hypothetical protein
MKVVSGIDVETRLEEAVRRVLDLQPKVRVLSLVRQADVSTQGTQRGRADIVARVATPTGEQFAFVVEAKSSGEPRIARLAAGQLRALIGSTPLSYGVFAAPYVAESTRRVCREEGIGFIDLCGNCLLAFDGVYLSVEGKPNLFRTGRGLKSLFGPKASRCVRVVLSEPDRDWRVKDLAAEARVSLGQAFNVKTMLLGAELVNELGKGPGRRFRLAKPEELLREWAANYSYTRNTSTGYYSFDDTRTLERRLAEYCRSNNITYAFTLTSGAALVAPMLRYDTAFAYVAGKQDELRLALGLKPVETGPNLILLEPYDEGVFYGARDVGVEGSPALAGRVVSDVQLFLDLKSYKARGEEAADFLLQQKLRPQWQKSIQGAK